MPAINPIAILVATVAALIIGTLYYMPSTPTGAKWAQLLKTPAVMRAPGQAMALQVVLSIVSMVVLAVLVRATGATGAAGGATVGFGLWIVVALADASNSNFSGRPWALWMVNQVNWLVTFLVAGAIVGSLG